jgi:hypothetical protein
VWNRDGDLHLTYVEPAVRRHPRPDLIWNAVFTVLRRIPEVCTRIDTITDVIVVEDEEGATSIVSSVVSNGGGREAPMRETHG